MVFDELVKFVVVILEALQTLNDKERLFANELLSSPKWASGPSVVVVPETRRRFGRVKDSQ